MTYAEADQIWNDLTDISQKIHPTVGTHTDPVRAKVKALIDEVALRVARIREYETKEIAGTR